jgi:hypothetical protein
MTAQDTATLDVVINGQGTGANLTFRLSTYNPISLADSPAVRDQLQLSSGSNSVPVKFSASGTQATFLLLLPDPANSVAIHYRGITSGDTGVATTTQPLLVPIPPSTNSVYITAASAATCGAIWI